MVFLLSAAEARAAELTHLQALTTVAQAASYSPVIVVTDCANPPAAAGEGETDELDLTSRLCRELDLQADRVIMGSFYAVPEDVGSSPRFAVDKCSAEVLSALRTASLQRRRVLEAFWRPEEARGELGRAR